jgi:hypothetical protein
MTNRKIFIQNYILSLKERTRNEKMGIQIGFDWIIYNLGLAKDWIPINLPFFRSADAKDFLTKTGAQFGVDMAFINNDELLIFVLKDEKLNNSNWTKHNFDSDIRMAAAPDLTICEGHVITSVKIILAYNKDEDDNGVGLFDRLIATFPSTISNGVNLRFDRWNITEIVDQVNNLLITPELLPQHLSSMLSYICAQVKDFTYGSEEWEKQLIPNWKNFLKILLSGKIDERRLRMVPVSLFIINNFGNTNRAFPAGWIDLIEWAMLAIWAKFEELDITLKQIMFAELWHSFYLTELEKYLITNAPSFYVEHGILSPPGVDNLSSLNDAFLTYWLIGRIGILHIGFQELLPREENKTDELLSKLILRSYEWIENILKNNPAAYRPLVDLNHIELYIIWMIVYQTDNKEFMKEWLSELESRLIVRRIGNSKIPFIEGRNRYDLVAEYSASFSHLQKKPDEFVDSSSYLILMLLELMFALNEKDRDIMTQNYYKHIVNGLGDDNKPLSDPPYQIDLQSWIPPEDWTKRIYANRVMDGISISIPAFDPDSGPKVSEKLKATVVNMEQQFPRKIIFANPLSSYILACIKNKSPLPPIFWRGSIFPELFTDKNEIKI